MAKVVKAGAKKSGSSRKRSVTPPSVLSDISPTRGEIKRVARGARPAELAASEGRTASISPLVGEMSDRTEGGNVERHALHAGATFSRQGVIVSTLPPASRISLRGPARSVSALSKAFGLDLPTKPKTSASINARHALWLGPDEWLVIDEQGADLIAACASVKDLHSAVEISHRNVAFAVSGSHCENAIAAGCPQDVSLNAFPVGACSRTILGKVEIVLYRTTPDSFRVECWRSFSDYVWDFLTEAAKDAAA